MTTPAFRDRYGLPLSTSSPVAAERYIEGIDRTLAGNAGADACLQEATLADEGFALAEVALARGLQFQGRVAEARQRAERARALAAGATRREQAHVEAMAVAIEGDGTRALALVREQVQEFPRDAFLLSQATGVYGLIGFSGAQDRSEQQLALLEPLASAYGEDWWFLSAHSFALHELYQFERARRLVERSLELYPRSAHGAHSLGHVFYETGDPVSGVAFLEDWMDGYDRSAILHGHLSWHLALFELASGRYRRALEVYERSIRPAATLGNALGSLADSAALLWRCELYGYRSAPLPWDEVREHAARSFPRAGVTWADLHAALTYAAVRDDAALQRLIGGLRQRLAAGRLPAGEATVHLAEGIAAFGRGDYEETVRLVEPVADQIVRMGGSNAQREVFEDTLLEAYLRSGRYDQAESLLRRRLDRRPSARDFFRLGRAQAARGIAEAEEHLRAARDRWTNADADAPEFT